MRLFLDVDGSGRRVARALRKNGHDVRAADEERDLDGMTDEDLLALATSDERILVTFNVAEFRGIVRRWTEQQRPHRGCAIVVGIDQNGFATIIRVITRMLAARPDPNAWREYTVFVARGN